MSVHAPPIARCRACKNPRLAEVWNLGQFALSDFTADGQADRAPLDLVLCPACGLVQLRHTTDRDHLYRRYFYRSGTQEAMVAALRDVVTDACHRVTLGPDSVWLDIGANDGTLLGMVPDGVRKLAYEPAENLQPLLMAAGVGVCGSYFPSLIGGAPVGLKERATVITSIACFYDADDPGAFCDAIRACLAPGGVWINQMAYLPATLRTRNVGDLCHEHLTYWTNAAFVRLAEAHGLRVVRAMENDVNGGSVRFVVQRAEDAGRSIPPPTDDVSAGDLARFKRAGRASRREIRTFLENAPKWGQRVLGYGASTKGNTYLQLWGVGPDLLPAIADRNPDKWGTKTPTGIPIISEAEARAEADVFLVLPWHFLESFKAREAAWLAAGGLFAVPFPSLRLEGLHAHSEPQAA